MALLIPSFQDFFQNIEAELDKLSETQLCNPSAVAEGGKWSGQGCFPVKLLVWSVKRGSGLTVTLKAMMLPQEGVTIIIFGVCGWPMWGK